MRCCSVHQSSWRKAQDETLNPSFRTTEQPPSARHCCAPDGGCHVYHYALLRINLLVDDILYLIYTLPMRFQGTGTESLFQLGRTLFAAGKRAAVLFWPITPFFSRTYGCTHCERTFADPLAEPVLYRTPNRVLSGRSCATRTRPRAACIAMLPEPYGTNGNAARNKIVYSGNSVAGKIARQIEIAIVHAACPIHHDLVTAHHALAC